MKFSFVLGTGLSSRLIAWYGQSYGGWSHVDALLPDGSLLGARSDTPGGTKSGVQIRPDPYERWARREILELPSNPAESFSWEIYLRAQVNKPYDSGSIWGFILGRADHEKGHWICSALQTSALEHVRKIPPLPVKTYQITPDALHLVLLALGARIVLKA